MVGNFLVKKKRERWYEGLKWHAFKVACIKLTREKPGISIRFILYFSSGKCWLFDFYSKLKRQIKIS